MLREMIILARILGGYLDEAMLGSYDSSRTKYNLVFMTVYLKFTFTEQVYVEKFMDIVVPHVDPSYITVGINNVTFRFKIFSDIDEPDWNAILYFLYNKIR
jgi:hypothetical protein